MTNLPPSPGVAPRHRPTLLLVAALALAGQVALATAVPSAPARADDTVTVIDHLPASTDGGSELSDVGWKALLFTTGTERTVIRSVTVGLNPVNSADVPSDVAVRIAIHRASGGIPGAQLASLPLTTIRVTALRQSYEFGGALRIELDPGTQYALVVSSDATGLKWANKRPSSFVVTSGFTLDGFRITTDSGATWAAPMSEDNAVAIAVGPAPTPPEPVVMTLDCGTGAPRAGAELVCIAAGGNPDIQVLWRAAAGDVVLSGPVALGPDGRGTFRLTVPPAAIGRDLTLELVEWLAPVPLGVVVGPVPRAVPAGDASTPVVTVLPFAAIAVVLGVLLGARRAGTRSRRSVG